MIELKNGRVKISGSKEELYEELVQLHLTIFQDRGLTDIATKALEEAGTRFITDDYKLTDIKKARFAGVDRKKEFERSEE